jgi:hypothetical protein
LRETPVAARPKTPFRPCRLIRTNATQPRTNPLRTNKQETPADVQIAHIGSMPANSSNAITGAIVRQAANGNQKLSLAAVFALELLSGCSVMADDEIFPVEL